MKPSKSLLAICLAFALVSVIPRTPAQTPQGQDEDVIRVNTDVTNLLFTATDKQNHFITTLRQEDIRMLEDGVPQQLFTFQRETDLPLSVALMIDVSISEQRTLPEEKAAAREFIQTIIRSTKDQAAIVPFEGFAHLEQGLTRNVIGLYQALGRVDVAMPSYPGSGPRIGGIASGPGIGEPSEGSTAIWDAVAVTSAEVLAHGPRQSRRAIILLTDGQDTSSRVRLSTAIDEAMEAETVVYAIGIGDRKWGGVNHDALSNLADHTGGRAFFPKKDTDLTAAFEQIEQELRSQYLLAYTPKNKQRDGKFRQMHIEIVNSELKNDLRLRYRPGYFARAR